MPPTLEVITVQMENLKKDIEETNKRNLKALEETEKRNLARHNELKTLLLDAIATKADVKDVAQIRIDVNKVESNQSRVAWIVLSAVLLAVIGLVITK